MAGRGTGERRETVGIIGLRAVPVPGSTVPKPKIAAVERRKALPRSLVFDASKIVPRPN
jgi:hypothetical protein